MVDYQFVYEKRVKVVGLNIWTLLTNDTLVVVKSTKIALNMVELKVNIDGKISKFDY